MTSTQDFSIFKQHDNLCRVITKDLVICQYFGMNAIFVQIITVVSNGLVAVGGKETQHDVWKYNGALDKWIQIEPLSTGRWRHKMAVHCGKVYALGGFDGVQRLSSVEAYDPFHNRWMQVNTIYVLYICEGYSL